MENINASTTAEHLNEYISTQLESNEMDALYVAYAMELIFGESIHKDVDGFITYASDPGNNISEEDIKFALCHDVIGGVSHDKLMLPRVSGYGKYSK